MNPLKERAIVGVLLGDERHCGVILQIQDTTAVVATGTSKYRLLSGLTIQPGTSEAVNLQLDRTTYFFATGIVIVDLGQLTIWRKARLPCRSDVYLELRSIALAYGRLLTRSSETSTTGSAEDRVEQGRR